MSTSRRSFSLFSLRFSTCAQGVTRNVPKAIELYEAAVKDELPDAQFHLGVMLDQGRDVRLRALPFALFDDSSLWIVFFSNFD